AAAHFARLHSAPATRGRSSLLRRGYANNRPSATCASLKRCSATSAALCSFADRDFSRISSSFGTLLGSPTCPSTSINADRSVSATLVLSIIFNAAACASPLPDRNPSRIRLKPGFGLCHVLTNHDSN